MIFRIETVKKSKAFNNKFNELNRQKLFTLNNMNKDIKIRNMNITSISNQLIFNYDGFHFF